MERRENSTMRVISTCTRKKGILFIWTISVCLFWMFCILWCECMWIQGPCNFPCALAYHRTLTYIDSLGSHNCISMSKLSFWFGTPTWTSSGMSTFFSAEDGWTDWFCSYGKSWCFDRSSKFIFPGCSSVQPQMRRYVQRLWFRFARLGPTLKWLLVKADCGTFRVL